VTRTSVRSLRSALLIGAVVAMAAAGVVFVRHNAPDDGRERNIAGGTDVAITGAPYQARLVSYSLKNDGTRDGGGLACGGTIIADAWVLTADHCIWRDAAKTTYPAHVAIGAGGSLFWSPTQNRMAKRILPARGVVGAWPNADLLLIEVDRPFLYGNNVLPAALPIGLDNATWPAIGATGLITGWGATLDNASQTSLRGVTMKVNARIDSPYCVDDGVPAYAYYGGYFVAARHLCLQRPATDMDASACSGDSGGPFAVTVGERPVLAGVASKAARDPRQPQPAPGTPVCTGTTPNLYERVAASLDWIVPGSVVGLSAETVRGVVTLRWQAPEKAPAVAINDYAIEYRPAGAGEWLLLNDGKSTATSATISGLVDGSSFDVRVAGVNAINEFDATIRQFASTTFVVGAPATTTTSTTTTVVTTTTLAPYTTTIAPSTTARQLAIGPRLTTTTRPPETTAPPTNVTTTNVTTTTVVPNVAPATTTAPAPTTTQPAVRPVMVDVEDPNFSRPQVTIPAGAVANTTPVTTAPVVERSRPAVGVSLTALQIAEISGVSVPAGASAGVTVAKGSAKVCRAAGAGVSFLAKGTCRATLRVGKGPGAAKKKAVRLTVP
jgi:secreted trypsin-like serine protease